MEPADINKLASNYWNADSRAIFIGHPGTLVPLTHGAKLGSEAELMLKILAEDYRNSLVLFSGGSCESLEKLSIAGFPITLVAEHGGFFRSPGKHWQRTFDHSTEWIDRLLPSLNSLLFQFEGSSVERNAFSLVWNYGSVADRLTVKTRNQIVAALKDLPDHGQFEVTYCEFTIELRTPGIDKGSFAIKWLEDWKFDFILAIGGAIADEELFRVLGSDGHTIKVGTALGSTANFNLAGQRDVLRFLNSIMQFRRLQFMGT